jgi:aminomethyltransferase
VKKTALYEHHVALGGRIVDFGGWALPVQYQGIAQEHLAVRTAAGLFDVSHMGEIRVAGADAGAFIQHMVTNDIKAAVAGRAVYSPMCYDDGGVVDDLLIYKYSDTEFLLVVNAVNADKDAAWLKEHIAGNVTVEKVSDDFAQLAIQGPMAETILQKLTDEPLDKLMFFRFRPDVKLDGISAMVSRSGYTGDDGFEIYLHRADAPRLWDSLLSAGRDSGLVPVGLGARDTLRLEAALPLYGQEISADISPLEAGLGRFVKLNKGDFIGREALLRQQQDGLRRTLVGFELTAQGIARSHYDVQSDGENIGFVTSGSMSPSLGKSIGLALIDSALASTGTPIDIMIRGKAVAAQVVGTPFYSKKYKQTAVGAQ